MKCRKSTKTTPGAAKNDPKRSPRRPKKRSRTTRRKKDRTKTILGPSWTPPGPIPQVQTCPWGSIWEAKTAPKSIPKRSKIERKIKTKKKRSKTILDPSWGDLEPSWVPSWADLDPKIVLSPRAALVFQKSTFLQKSCLKTRLGPILGRFGSPKGVVLGDLLGIKLGQQRYGKVMRKNASSWTGLGGGASFCGWVTLARL